MHESKSRMCGIDLESAADGGVQSPGGTGYRNLRRRMQLDADRIFQRIEKQPKKIRRRRLRCLSYSLHVHCASNTSPRRYLASQLNPGDLTAPGRFCLVLLRSRPDTVHRFPPRKTQVSTPLNKGSSTRMSPLRNITPTIADCRYKVPLTPRLHEF